MGLGGAHQRGVGVLRPAAFKSGRSSLQGVEIEELRRRVGQVAARARSRTGLLALVLLERLVGEVGVGEHLLDVVELVDVIEQTQGLTGVGRL